MSHKTINAIEFALDNLSLSPTARKLIVAPASGLQGQTKIPVIELKHNFNVDDAIALIGNINYIGIVMAEEFDAVGVGELINMLITTNKTTVVLLNDSPMNCKVFYPIPAVGTKHIEGNYEYSYGQEYLGVWNISSELKGWGVRIIDKSQTEYESPLPMIRGYPVTNMSCLFNANVAPEINLIDWDTSNVTDMSSMFAYSLTTDLDLSGFDTSNVTDISFMFYNSEIKNLIARTQADADKYKQSLYFPSFVNVTVKS